MIFNGFKLEDLFLIPSRDFTDEDGHKICCVYCKVIDAVTFISESEIEELKRQGIGSINELPEE